jgi:predicted AAA+ superfamily ATPase
MKHLIEQGTQTNEILFINKENSYRSYIKNNEDILQLITHQKFIFIDEIQDIENWQLAIRHLQHTGEYDIFIS